MLYFIQAFLELFYVSWLIKTKKVSWRSCVTIYTLAVLFTDIIEVIFNVFLNLYKFPAQIFSDPDRDNFLGIICADTIILPMTAIIFCYFVKNRPWKMSIIFTLVIILMEWIYLKLEYLVYLNWTIYLSALSYFIGFSVHARFANRLIESPNKIPYFIRLTCFAYFVLVIPGAIPDVLFHLHYWSPGIMSDFWSDDRIAALGSNLIIAIIIGIIIPRTSEKYKLPTFIFLALLTVLFGLFSYWKGWLIYVKWNHLLTIIRYSLPFAALMWYDKWQGKTQ